jgi:hypothetical protein
MANSKDFNDVSLDSGTRLANLSIAEHDELEDYMKNLDEEFHRQQAQKREVMEKWYLSHFRIVGVLGPTTHPGLPLKVLFWSRTVFPTVARWFVLMHERQLTILYRFGPLGDA